MSPLQISDPLLFQALLWDELWPLRIHLNPFMEQNDSFSCAIADFQAAMTNPNWTRHRWSRRGWNGPGQFIELQVPDEHSKMTRPYLFITTVQGDRVPWLASQTDLLATDWYIV